MNAPRTWPNSSLSNSVSTTAEQLTVTNGDRAAGRLMERAGDELLARARLAGNEHRSDMRRQPPNHAEQLLHDRAAPDHPAELELLGDVAFDREEAARGARALRGSSSAAARSRSKSNGLLR